MKRTESKTRFTQLRMWTAKRLVVIATLCALSLTPVAPMHFESAYAAPDSVTLSVAEADSLVNLIDDQDEDIQLLRIDLREARQLAAADSVLHVEQLRLYRAERPNWIERILNRPSLWFMIGVVAGLYSQSHL